MEETLWLIISPKYEVKILFRTNWLGKWLLSKLMKHKKLTMETIKQEKIRGHNYTGVYVDEI